MEIARRSSVSQTRLRSIAEARLAGPALAWRVQTISTISCRSRTLYCPVCAKLSVCTELYSLSVHSDSVTILSDTHQNGTCTHKCVFCPSGAQIWSTSKSTVSKRSRRPMKSSPASTRSIGLRKIISLTSIRPQFG